ncbi:phosphate/phosphite/phosphonate ABC transporter substrate-binding protein [Prosthecomicrobium sp. N25]|uniref:phosphate/phosphite/phosphonate ABC transporter substrate-binding protein n=1 Tax=Prosthecomicrobium sp. N25 TaxID=3129254 RepID=UPI0030772C94
MPIRFALAAVLAALALVAPAGAQTSVVVVPGIKIGVVGGDRLQAVQQRIEPFRRRLAEEIGTSVTVLPMKDGQTLVDAFATGRVDYAVLSATGYAMAWRLCGCVEPIAAPRSIDGTGSYRSILVVKAASPAARLEDLKGRTVAVSDERSVAGRLWPFAEWARAGIEPETFFGRIETVRGPDAAVRQLLAGKVDAAVAWSDLEGDSAAGYDRGTLRALVDRKALDMADIRILWRSSAIPHGPHAVRASLSDGLKARIRDTLVHLKSDDPAAYEAIEPELGGGFGAVSHGLYEPLLVLVTPKPRPSAAPAATARPPG